MGSGAGKRPLPGGKEARLWIWPLCPSRAEFMNLRAKYQGSTKFPKIWEPPQNSRRHKGDMKQDPYWVTTRIRHHRNKFSIQGDLVTGKCAPLAHIHCRYIWILYVVTDYTSLFPLFTCNVMWLISAVYRYLIQYNNPHFTVASLCTSVIIVNITKSRNGSVSTAHATGRTTSLRLPVHIRNTSLFFLRTTQLLLQWSPGASS
jgi:hypothetical protein